MTQKALKYFDAAIAVDPFYAYALSNKVKLRQGAWKKKQSFWQKAVRKEALTSTAPVRDRLLQCII
jgi:hypothetical protein